MYNRRIRFGALLELVQRQLSVVVLKNVINVSALHLPSLPYPSCEKCDRPVSLVCSLLRATSLSHPPFCRCFPRWTTSRPALYSRRCPDHTAWRPLKIKRVRHLFGTYIATSRRDSPSRLSTKRGWTRGILLLRPKKADRPSKNEIFREFRKCQFFETYKTFL